MLFDRSKYIALDLETTGEDEAFGLQPWRLVQQRAAIRAVSVASYADSRMQVEGRLDPCVKYLRKILVDAAAAGNTIIGWNTPFDVAWLLAAGLQEEVWACRWLDAQLLWMHSEREPEYDVKGEKRRGWRLEDAVLRYYPKHAEFKQITDFHTTDPVLLQRLLLRNKMDAACTLGLAEQFWCGLVDTQQRCAVIEAASIPSIARANLCGMQVSAQQIEHLNTTLEATAAEHLKTLERFGATPTILASPQQLATLMFDDWKLPTIKMTDGGQRSTDKEVLYELAPGDARANLVKEYREANNNRTKFVANIAASATYNSDGHTRPQARMYGTYTGRLVYTGAQGRGVKEVQTGFALHQMKREKSFRETIEAPEDYVIVEFDAANQEYRLMAIQSGDPVMLDLCQPGEDPHGYMGAQIGRVDYQDLMRTVHDEMHLEYARAKQLRQFGKVANLSFSYRVGVDKATSTARVQHGLDVDKYFVSKMQRTYMQTYRQVRPYWDRAIHKAARLGYAESLGGRRVQLAGNWSGKYKWQLESTAINFPIQGTGADQKFLAMAMCKPILTKYSGYFYFELHDGLYFILRRDNHMSAIQEIRRALNNLPYQKAWGFTPPIPLPWDCKLGESWGGLKELKAA